MPLGESKKAFKTKFSHHPGGVAGKKEQRELGVTGRSFRGLEVKELNSNTDFATS